MRTNHRKGNGYRAKEGWRHKMKKWVKVFAELKESLATALAYETRQPVDLPVTRNSFEAEATQTSRDS
jgi:hypothetical protein